MIGLDTNVLVRFLIQDDPLQAQKATHFIEKAAQNENDLYLGNIVCCELVWVLESVYEMEKSAVIECLEKILATTQFMIENKDQIYLAIQDFKTSKADFSDCLIGRLNQFGGCEYTVTFDNGTKNLSYFKIIH